MSISLTTSRPKVIGIILAYKHASFLARLYESLPLDALDEVIIANDDSGDDIEAVAARLGIPCFSHPRLGYGGNMKFGLDKAMARGADYMVEIHGDGQFDTSLFLKPALEKVREGYDLVLGSRFVDIKQPLRDKMPMVKYLGNIGLSFIERIIVGVPLTEFHTGARLYSRRILETVDRTHTSNGFLFGFEIIAQAAYHRFRITEVPTRSYYDREHTSISLTSSAIYFFQSLGVLLEYLAARAGFSTRLFHHRRARTHS
jgi:glycosyltransferase involved in cell wall biosynthesis